ncbi:MAG TPA: BatA domain-containing protein [Bacteroidales bacterium]|nr:BatA domain-containing protein [Bacteroidales bacterium]HRZ49810.1 BatA domain-containing protein [Bacteroidales bacterium]
MQFLYPNILFALLALSIPVLVHLFNFRKPRKVFFTNVRFLRELKLESRKKSRIRHLLVLLARMLALTALVMAFAGPVLLDRGAVPLKGKPLVVVYLDNSYSMQAQGRQGILLETAARKAAEVAGYYGPSEEFYLITNDFSATFSRIVNRSDFLNLLSSVRYSPVSRSAQEIYERVGDLKKRNPSRAITLFMISDFQLATVKPEEATPPEGIRGYLVPLAGTSDHNLYIDSVWSEIPVMRTGQVMELFARVGNSGSSDAEEVPIALNIHGKEVAVAAVTVPAGARIPVKLSARIPSEGIYQGFVSLEDNPIIFDDRFYLGFRVAAARNLLLLDGDQKDVAFSRIFGNDSLFRLDVRPSTQIDYAALSRYDMIFLNGIEQVTDGMQDALVNYVTSGGSMAVLPPSAGKDPAQLNALLNTLGVAAYGTPDTADTRVSSINTEHPLFKGVFATRPTNPALPRVNTHYPLILKGEGKEDWIMKMLNDRPFWLSSTSGKGAVYLFAVPLTEDYSNLAALPELFVPPVVNMALYSGVAPPLFNTLGIDKSAVIPWDGVMGEEPFRVKANDSPFEFIPGHRSDPFGYLLFFEDQVVIPGNYQVFAGDSVIAPLAFNLRDTESDMQCADEKKLQNWLEGSDIRNFTLLKEAGKSTGDKLRESSEGKPLWRFFVMASLIFLLIEVILLRRNWPWQNDNTR